MVIKGWLLGNNYVLKMMILFLGWTMVRKFAYKKREYKKTKGLVWRIDILTIKAQQ